ncbi:MAG: ABC transporter permease, partial [Dehalococcoidia bacterium]
MAETTAEPAGRRRDERVGRRNVVRQLLGRPELGAVAGAIIVWAFFAITAGDNGFLSERGTASYLEVSAELGIMAVAVALLMIGGEFDLSVGSVIGASSMTIAILTTESGWNIWPAILAAFAVALAIGFVNGMLVVKTGLPSFIITLGALFAVRGATIGLTREITGRTQVPGVDEAGGFGLAEDIFTTEISGEFAISIVWWLGLAAIATWILLRTRFGNWIFGAGGSKEAARNAGVPVDRVKIMLFMTSA